MSEYCRAVYADGRVFERDYADTRGMKINGRRPVTVWMVNPCEIRLLRAQHTVCPYVGVVFVGYTDV